MQEKKSSFAPSEENTTRQISLEISNRLSLCDSLSYDENNQRLIIPYFSLKGNPYKLPNDSAFVRYRNYSPTAKAKYQSPAKRDVGAYDTPFYYPLDLQAQFQNSSLPSNTIVLTEGEFKAITAVQNDITCVSFAGTSLYNHALAYVHELQALTERIKEPTVNFVLLFDADAIDPYNKKGFTNARLNDFNRSAKKFFEVIDAIKTEKKKSIYIGYIDHKEKGLDDLLLSLSDSKRKNVAYQINNPKFCADYFSLIKVTKRTFEDKVNALFPSYNLHAFLEKYRDKLRGNHFSFKHYQKNRSYTIQYFLDENNILSAKDTFYEHFDGSFHESHEFSRYADEQFDVLLKKLKIEKKVLLSAPTGAGKTTLTTALQKHYHRIILLEPTRAIAKQQTGYTLSIGGVKHDVSFHVDDIVLTFAKLKHDGILTDEDFQNSLLVVDEAHEVYKSFGFRPSECAMIERLIQLFSNVLATTATPVVPFFRALDFYCIELIRKDQVHKSATVSIVNTGYKKTKGGSVNYGKLIHDCVVKSRSKDRKAYIYHVSKENHVINQYHKIDPFGTMLITGQTSRNEYRTVYNTMLSTQHAFVGGYDVLLTNSILETGASFKDENVDVYILFANDAASMVQACARFRKTESVEYSFFIKKQDWQSAQCYSPKNDLKNRAFTILKEQYNAAPDANIFSSMTESTCTHNEAFSYCSTFFHFEQNRIQGQPHTKLLGNLMQSFSITDCTEIEPPRAEKIKADAIAVKPTNILNGTTINRALIPKLLSQLREDKRQFSAFERFDEALQYLEPKSSVKTTDQFQISKESKQTLKLILFCTDTALKFKKDVEHVLAAAQRIIAHLEKAKKPIDLRVIEHCLLLQFLQLSPNTYYKRIQSRGKRQEWFHILEVIKQTKHAFHHYTIYDLWKSPYFKNRSERDLKRYVQFMNLWMDMIQAESGITLKRKELTVLEALIDTNLSPVDIPYKTLRTKKKRSKPLSVEELRRLEEIEFFSLLTG